MLSTKRLKYTNRGCSACLNGAGWELLFDRNTERSKMLVVYLCQDCKEVLSDHLAYLEEPSWLE